MNKAERKQLLKEMYAKIGHIDREISKVKKERHKYMTTDKSYHCGNAKHVDFNIQIDTLTKEYNMLNKKVDEILEVC